MIPPEPRDWSADFCWLVEEFRLLLHDMELMGWTEDEVFEELEQYYGRKK